MKDPGGAGLLMFDLLDQANVAEKKKDYAAAAKAYAALTQIVPERALAFSKLCEMDQLLGQRAQGIAACFRATGLGGAKVEDFLRYASLILSKPDGQSLTEGEVKELRSTFEHLKQEHVDRRDVDVVECQFAVTLEDREAMRQCVQRLKEKAPNDPVTVTYDMSLALAEKDYLRATTLIAQARQLQMSPDSITLMQNEIDVREHGSIAAPDSGSKPFPTTPLLAVLGTAAVGGGAALWSKRRRAKAV